jgi:outer membrane protein, heavy metal efflux system
MLKGIARLTSLVCAFSSAAVHAQDLLARAPVATLLRSEQSLAEWVTTHSAEVRASHQELLAAQALRREAALLPNPSLDLAVSNIALGATNPSNHPRDKTLIYGAGVSELIELGKRGPRIEAAQLRSDAARERFAVAVADRIAEARTALASLVYSQVRSEALESSREQAAAAAEVARGRYKFNTLSGVDFDRVQNEFIKIEIEARDAQAEFEAAQAECTALLRADCDATAATADLIDNTAWVPSSAAEATLYKRADMRALKLEGRAAAQDAATAAAKVIPDLTVRLGYTRDMFVVSGDLAHSLAASISAPLPFFDRGQHAESEARARVALYAELADASLVRARGEIAGLHIRHRAIIASLARLENEALPRANEILAAEEHGLNQGDLDITDLILSRREAIALKMRALDLHFQLFTIRNDMRRALGLDERVTVR